MLKPLKLHASLGSWQKFNARKAQKSFLAVKKQIHERDKHSCGYCGFKATIHMNVVNIDHNYDNNDPENMITACPLCTQCHFLETVGEFEHCGGTLIYFPSMSCAELNGLCHVLFCAMSSPSQYQSNAQSIYRELKLCSKAVEDHFGENMANPAVFGRALLDSHVENTAEKGLKLLRDIRLLPSRSQFKTLISEWTENASN